MTIADFRNTKQVFYGGNEIKEVWYGGEKLWSKTTEVRIECYYAYGYDGTNTVPFYYNDTSVQFSKIKYIEYKGVKFDLTGYEFKKNTDNVWVTGGKGAVITFLKKNGAKFQGTAFYPNPSELYLIAE